MEHTGYLGEKMLVKAHAEQNRSEWVLHGVHSADLHIGMSAIFIVSRKRPTPNLSCMLLKQLLVGASIINIHSPDTDVFVLAIRRFCELCSNTNL